MTASVEMRVRRILSAHPETDVRFTPAISPTSFHESVRKDGSVLFLHPHHHAFVEQLRGLA